MPYPLYFVKERVGVGVPDPETELDVRGDGQFTGDLDVTGTITAGGTPVGTLVVATVGSTPSAAGASASGLTLTLQPADATHPGVVTSGTQTIGGAKTFSSTLAASNLSGTNSGDVTLTAVGAVPNANGASLSTQALTLQPADGTNPGLLTAAAQTIGGAKTFSGGVVSDTLTSATATTVTVTSSMANGSSAVAAIVNSSVTYSTAGAKLLSVKNNGTEKAAIDKDGNVVPGSDEGANLGTSALRWASVNTDALKCQSDTRLNIGGGVLNTYTDGIGSPGAGSVAHSFTTHAAFSTAGGKLLQVKNLSTEKCFIDKDGQLELTTAGKGIILQSPDGTRYLLTIANGGTVSIAAA